MTCYIIIIKLVFLINVRIISEGEGGTKKDMTCKIILVSVYMSVYKIIYSF